MNGRSGGETDETFLEYVRWVVGNEGIAGSVL